MLAIHFSRRLRNRMPTMEQLPWRARSAAIAPPHRRSISSSSSWLSTQRNTGHTHQTHTIKYTQYPFASSAKNENRTRDYFYDYRQHQHSHNVGGGSIHTPLSSNRTHTPPAATKAHLTKPPQNTIANLKMNGGEKTPDATNATNATNANATNATKVNTMMNGAMLNTGFNPDDGQKIFASFGTLELLNSAVLFTLCSSEMLVNIMIKMMNRIYNVAPKTPKTGFQLSKIPGGSVVLALWEIAKKILSYPLIFVIRKQYFPLFTGGETLDECVQKAKKYAASGIRLIIDNSTEEAFSDDDYNRNLNSKKKLIDTAYESLRGSVVCMPIKITGLCSPSILESMTKIINQKNAELSSMFEWDMDPRPYMSDAEIIELDVGMERILELMTYAKQRGLLVWIDAEQFVRQPGLNYMSRQIQTHMNVNAGDADNHKVYVYNTYQTYLTASSDWIKFDLEFAAKNGFNAGMKIVRGAYMEAEQESAVLEQRPDPIQPSKEATDRNYDAMVRLVMHRVSASIVNPHRSNNNNVAIAVCSHNRYSLLNGTGLMHELGIPRNEENVLFAQLQGMCDNETYGLGINGYNGLKLIPYGSFDEVWPYLMRRLQENQSVFGGTSHEKAVYWREIRRRLVPFV